jgi:26S proteasome regulatory subunit N13
MPQPLGSGVPSGEHTNNPGGGGLTLADLQGAMAGLATASPVSTSPPVPLSELVSSDIIQESGILNDEAAVARLTALLPEGQQTRDALLENLRSPQVMQCLQRLTAALGEDAESFNSVIANFELNPEDGGGALLERGDPVEAFLNCLLKDVERKEGVKKKEEEEEGEKKDGDDDKMDEGS